MENSKIEWTHATFNPWRGCVKISEACRNCYAEVWAKRTGKAIWGKDAAREMAADAYWKQPVKWNVDAVRSGQPYRVFCGSLMDVCEDRPDLEPSRVRLMDLIERTPALTWLLLTKRPENFNRLFAWPKVWPGNVWAGCTAENQERLESRLPYLLDIPASVRFLSIEPLLGEVDLEAAAYKSGRLPESEGLGVSFVIVGGESGPKARPMNPDWARSLRDQCQAAGVPFMFKQWGEWWPGEPGRIYDHPAQAFWTDGVPMVRCGKTKAGRLLDGIEHNGYPVPGEAGRGG